MKKYIVKDGTMNDGELKRVYNVPIYARDSEKITNKKFVTLGNGEQGGTQWRCFYIKYKRTFYFDRFERQAYNFFLFNNFQNRQHTINTKFKISM